MRRLRTKAFLRRLLIAALALWLPMASGQGGKATCIATSSFAKTLLAASTARPHLSCHGEKGDKTKKACCCRSEETLRSGRCGCHDGDPVYGAPVHDPMIGPWNSALAPAPFTYSANTRRSDALFERPGDGPDPPPPRSFSFDLA